MEDEDIYDVKINDMQKYVIFLTNVVNSLKDRPNDKFKDLYFAKMQVLLDLLTNRSKRVKLPILLKSEIALKSLYDKYRETFNETLTKANEQQGDEEKSEIGESSDQQNKTDQEASADVSPPNEDTDKGVSNKTKSFQHETNTDLCAAQAETNKPDESSSSIHIKDRNELGTSESNKEQVDQDPSPQESISPKQNTSGMSNVIETQTDSSSEKANVDETDSSSENANVDETNQASVSQVANESPSRPQESINAKQVTSEINEETEIEPESCNLKIVESEVGTPESTENRLNQGEVDSCLPPQESTIDEPDTSKNHKKTEPENSVQKITNNEFGSCETKENRASQCALENSPCLPETGNAIKVTNEINKKTETETENCAQKIIDSSDTSERIVSQDAVGESSCPSESTRVEVDSSQINKEITSHDAVKNQPQVQIPEVVTNKSPDKSNENTSDNAGKCDISKEVRSGNEADSAPNPIIDEVNLDQAEHNPDNPIHSINEKNSIPVKKPEKSQTISCENKSQNSAGTGMEISNDKKTNKILPLTKQTNVCTAFGRPLIHKGKKSISIKSNFKLNYTASETNKSDSLSSSQKQPISKAREQNTKRNAASSTRTNEGISHRVQEENNDPPETAVIEKVGDKNKRCDTDVERTEIIKEVSNKNFSQFIINEKKELSENTKSTSHSREGTANERTTRTISILSDTSDVSETHTLPSTDSENDCVEVLSDHFESPTKYISKPIGRGSATSHSRTSPIRFPSSDSEKESEIVLSLSDDDDGVAVVSVTKTRYAPPAPFVSDISDDDEIPGCGGLNTAVDLSDISDISQSLSAGEDSLSRESHPRRSPDRRSYTRKDSNERYSDTSRSFADKESGNTDSYRKACDKTYADFENDISYANNKERYSFDKELAELRQKRKLLEKKLATCRRKKNSKRKKKAKRRRKRTRENSRSCDRFSESEMDNSYSKESSSKYRSRSRDSSPKVQFRVTFDRAHSDKRYKDLEQKYKRFVRAKDLGVNSDDGDDNDSLTSKSTSVLADSNLNEECERSYTPPGLPPSYVPSDSTNLGNRPEADVNTQKDGRSDNHEDRVGSPGDELPESSSSKESPVIASTEKEIYEKTESPPTVDSTVTSTVDLREPEEHVITQKAQETESSEEIVSSTQQSGQTPKSPAAAVEITDIDINQICETLTLHGVNYHSPPPVEEPIEIADDDNVREEETGNCTEDANVDFVDKEPSIETTSCSIPALCDVSVSSGTSKTTINEVSEPVDDNATLSEAPLFKRRLDISPNALSVETDKEAPTTNAKETNLKKTPEKLFSRRPVRESFGDEILFSRRQKPPQSCDQKKKANGDDESSEDELYKYALETLNTSTDDASISESPINSPLKVGKQSSETRNDPRKSNIEASDKATSSKLDANADILFEKYKKVCEILPMSLPSESGRLAATAKDSPPLENAQPPKSKTLNFTAQPLDSEILNITAQLLESQTLNETVPPPKSPTLNVTTTKVVEQSGSNESCTKINSLVTQNGKELDQSKVPVLADAPVMEAGGASKDALDNEYYDPEDDEPILGSDVLYESEGDSTVPKILLAYEAFLKQLSPTNATKINGESRNREETPQQSKENDTIEIADNSCEESETNLNVEYRTNLPALQQLRKSYSKAAEEITSQKDNAQSENTDENHASKEVSSSLNQIPSNVDSVKSDGVEKNTEGKQAQKNGAEHKEAEICTEDSEEVMIIDDPKPPVIEIDGGEDELDSLIDISENDIDAICGIISDEDLLKNLEVPKLNDTTDLSQEQNESIIMAVDIYADLQETVITTTIEDEEISSESNSSRNPEGGEPSGVALYDLLFEPSDKDNSSPGDEGATGAEIITETDDNATDQIITDNVESVKDVDPSTILKEDVNVSPPDIEDKAKELMRALGMEDEDELNTAKKILNPETEDESTVEFDMESYKQMSSKGKGKPTEIQEKKPIKTEGSGIAPKSEQKSQSSVTTKKEDDCSKETKIKAKLPNPKDKDKKVHSEKELKIHSFEKALMSCATYEKSTKAKSSKDDQYKHRKTEDKEKKEKSSHDAHRSSKKDHEKVKSSKSESRHSKKHDERELSRHKSYEEKDRKESKNSKKPSHKNERSSDDKKHSSEASKSNASHSKKDDSNSSKSSTKSVPESSNVNPKPSDSKPNETVIRVTTDAPEKADAKTINITIPTEASENILEKIVEKVLKNIMLEKEKEKKNKTDATDVNIGAKIEISDKGKLRPVDIGKLIPVDSDTTCNEPKGNVKPKAIKNRRASQFNRSQKDADTMKANSEERTSKVPEPEKDKKPKASNKGGGASRELEKLNKDIADSFICKDILNLSSRRGCYVKAEMATTLQMKELNLKDSPKGKGSISTRSTSQTRSISAEPQDSERVAQPTKTKYKCMPLSRKYNIKNLRVNIKRLRVDADGEYTLRKKLRLSTTEEKSPENEQIASPQEQEMDSEDDDTLLKPLDKTPPSDGHVSPSEPVIRNNKRDYHYHCDQNSLCMICDVQLPDTAQLVNHYVNKHTRNEVLISRLPQEDIDFLLQNIPYTSPEGPRFRGECVFCKEIVVLHKSSWFEHILSHTGEYMYECGNCKNKAIRVRDIQHSPKCKVTTEVKQLMTIDMKDNKIKLFSCKKCNYVQHKLCNIGNHLTKTHHQARSSKAFESLTVLQFPNEKPIKKKLSKAESKSEVEGEIIFQVQTRPYDMVDSGCASELIIPDAEVDANLIDSGKVQGPQLGKDDGASNNGKPLGIVTPTVTGIKFGGSIGIRETENSAEQETILPDTDPHVGVSERKSSADSNYKLSITSLLQENVPSSSNGCPLSLIGAMKKIVNTGVLTVTNSHLYFYCLVSKCRFKMTNDLETLRKHVASHPEVVVNDVCSTCKKPIQGSSSIVTINDEIEHLKNYHLQINPSPAIPSTSSKRALAEPTETPALKQMRLDTSNSATMNQPLVSSAVQPAKNKSASVIVISDDEEDNKDELQKMLFKQVQKTENIDTKPSKPVLEHLKLWLKETQSSKTDEICKSFLHHQHLRQLFKCMGNNCIFSTDLPDTIMEHFERHEKYTSTTCPKPEDIKSWLECAYCERFFDTKSKYISHIAEKHNFSGYQCGRCFYRDSSMQKIYDHVKSCHKMGSCPVMKVNVVSFSSSNYFVTEIDSRNASQSNQSLSRDIFPCPFCEYSAISLKETREHVLSKHCIDIRPESEKFL